ncbi:UNVERIFIED_CONTAM: hypothetical protein Sradi_4909400 [Sesamum radiatum]|uniref:Uncharacterized protein n=1 Tax=Sesamum radiatum TaxID=300843 RepID=A0AAW2MD48_SESRA
MLNCIFDFFALPSRFPGRSASFSSLAPLAPVPSPPKAVGTMANPPQCSTSSNTSTEEISPALLGPIRQIISTAIREQVAALAPARVATPSDVDVPKEEPKGVLVPAPCAVARQGPPRPASKRSPRQ